MNEAEHERGVLLSPTTRVEAFSDGVMAIAITLLILEIHVPDAAGRGELLPRLVGLWPSYLAYADSFLTIGAIWLSHHAFFRRIRHVDTFLHWGNLLLLLVVAFIPFPTAVLARFLAHGGTDARVAAAFYGLVATLQSAAWLVLWAAVRRRPQLLEEGFDVHFARKMSRLAWIGIAAFGLCACLALFHPTLALCLYLLAVLGFAVISTGWLSERHRHS